MLDNEPDNKHFSLQKIQENEKEKSKRAKKRKTDVAFNDTFKIDVNDERFSALYTSHLYNIDPANPQFRATKATRELIEEKLKRRERIEVSSTIIPTQPQLIVITNSCIKSLFSLLGYWPCFRE